MPSELRLYGLQNTAVHLARRGAAEQLERLLGQLSYLRDKLAAFGVPALLADYEHLPADSALRSVQAAIRLGTQALERDPAQLPAQLLGRLQEGAGHPVLSGLLVAAAGVGRLVPLTRSLGSGRGGLRQSRHLVSGAQAAALTSDGKQAVCGSRNLVRIWDLTGKRAERVIAGHRNRVSAVAVSAGDRWIVAADETGTVCVWELESGRLIHRWQGHEGKVESLVCAPDGGCFLSGGADGLVKVWELPGGAELQRLAGHTAAVGRLALSADGRTAVSSGDQTLRVWDLSGAAPPRLHGPDQAWASPVALTAQGLLIASPGKGRILVQELATGRVLRELETESELSDLLVSADGNRLVVVAAEHLEIWDLAAGTKRILPGPELARGRKVLFPDGTRLLAAGSNLIVWDLEAELEAEAERIPIAALAIAPDGRSAVSSSSAAVLTLWSLPGGEMVRRLSGSKVNALTFTPDGTQIITGDHRGELTRWDRASGEPRAFAAYEKDNPVMALAFTGDGRHLISGSGWGDVTVWELETGRCVCEHRLSPCYLTCLALIPGTRKVVVGVHHEDDQAPIVLDLEDGTWLGRLRGHVDAVLAVAVSPDGRTAVTGAQDRTLRVWDLATGAAVWILNDHRGWPYSLAFVDEGRHVVSCSDDWTVKVWDIERGRCVATFTGDRPLHGVAVTRDGRTVVAGGLAGDLHVLRWTGQPAS